MKNIIKNVRTFHVLKIASAVFTQLASLYLVYALSPDEFGKFSLIATVAQLMFIMTSGWSSGSLINLGSKRFAETGSYLPILAYRISIVVVSMVIVSIVFCTLKGPIEDFMNIKGSSLYVFLLFLGYVLYDYASQLLYPGNKDTHQTIVEFMTSLVFLACVVFIINNISDYIKTYFFAALAFSIVVSIIFYKTLYAPNFSWNKREFNAVLHYSAWQTLSVASIYIINMGTNYVLVAENMTHEQIGVYNLAYRLYSGFSPFFALFGILIPKWMHSPNLKFSELDKKIKKIVLGLGSIYLLVGFTLMPVVSLLGMSKYSESVHYFFYLFPAFIFSCYSNLVNTVIANTSYFRKSQFGILIQSLILITCCIFLVKYFGMMGAVVAITCASISGALYLNMSYRSIMNIKRG